MTEQASEQVKVEETTQGTLAIVPHDPIFINTKHGAVSVYGHEFLAKKELLQLGYCLTMEEFENTDHKVRMVTFLDNNKPCNRKGKAVLAQVVGDIGAIVINLRKHFDQAFKLAIDEDTSCSSIQAMFHNLIAQSYLHEIHHLAVDEKAPDNLETLSKEVQDKWKKIMAEEEEVAEEWAREQSWELAKLYDVELPNVAESPFFAEKVEEMFKILAENDKYAEIIETQRHLLDNHLLMHIPASEETKECNVMTYREWCHLMSGADENDEGWNAPLTKTDDLTTLIKELGETFQPVLPMSMVSNPSMPVVATAGPQPVQTSTVVLTQEGMNQMDAVGEQYGEWGEEPPEMDMVMNAFVPAQAVTAAAPIQTAAPMVAGAGALPSPADQPKVQAVYPPSGMTDVETEAVVRRVYMQAFNTIFGGPCGQLINSDLGFQDSHGVVIAPIALAEEETKVIVFFAFLDANNRWTPKIDTKITKCVRGFVTKTTSLPMYKIFINVNGEEHVRIMVPQNPAKRNASGELTRTAAMARQGTRIMHIMDGADTPAGTKSNYIYKIVDGNFVEGR